MGLIPTRPERAFWHPKFKFIYSPDGITDDRPHQIKEVRMAPMTKPLREKGFSVEQRLIEERPEWFSYELQTMWLFGVTYSYLTVWYLNDHSAMTYKITSTEEEVKKVGNTLMLRIGNIQSHQLLDTEPSPKERLSPSNCRNKWGDVCDFLHETPCLNEVPLLDMIAASASA